MFCCAGTLSLPAASADDATMELIKVLRDKGTISEQDYQMLQNSANQEAMKQQAAAQAAEDKGLELSCLVYPDVPSLVRGDPGRLRQALQTAPSMSIQPALARLMRRIPRPAQQRWNAAMLNWVYRLPVRRPLYQPAARSLSPWAMQMLATRMR